MQRPVGVTAIAITLFLVAGYLAVVAVVKIASPDAISLSLGAPFLHGLEISGPYMFLIASVIASLVGFGLIRRRNLARRAAIALAFAGMIMLVPKLSADAGELSPRLLISGFAVMVRVVIVWYLWQSWTAEEFH